MKTLYQVTTTYFCAGIICENDTVIETAPILNWSLGRTLTKLTKWVETKNGNIIKICEWSEDK